MPNSLPTSAVNRLRERLETPAPTMAKADLKEREPRWRADVGQALDRGIKLAGRNQKDTWVALGHNDGAQLSRWIAGTERPQFDVLFAVDWLRQPLVIALAALAELEVETTIRVKRFA